MTIEAPAKPASYWWRHTDGEGGWRAKEGPPGAELAALRRGLNQEPGDVPEMWRFYRHWSDDGRPTNALRAEHFALGLFAVHQQSQSRPMHRKGVGFGTAVRALLAEGVSVDDEKAVSRRFAAAATATSLGELVMHVRGLVRQLNDKKQPLDYEQLFWDLCAWPNPERRARVRRRWGAQYFVRPAKDTTDTTDTTDSNSQEPS